MKTFTKIRKWAEEKGYKVEERNYSRPSIRVVISEEQSFELDMRESTIYHSIRGMKGDCAGLYLAENLKPKSGKFIRSYSFHQRTQKEAIESMEKDIRDWANNTYLKV